MSFAGDVKTELCRGKLGDKSAAQAEACGVLLYCNRFTLDQVKIVTESPAFAKRLPGLFRKAFGLTFDEKGDPGTPGKRIFTIEDGSRELQLIREQNGRVVNSVVHTQTRDSENERQRIDQIALLDIALRFNPDIIAVGEMRGPEANAAQEAARVGVAVLTTIHSSSSEGTYRRMVSLCKRAVDTPDDTLMGYVTEAYPIVVSCRQLENKERRITNISECEILPDGSRRLHKLYEYNITENRLEGDRFIIEGHHQKCEEMSESLQRRFIETGMPRGELEQFIQRKEETA